VLRSHFTRLDYSTTRPPSTRSSMDTDNVYKRGFLAWFMSARPKQQEVRCLAREVRA
jgi:spore germination cell wall hydrolase CwlJ-like protein